MTAKEFLKQKGYYVGSLMLSKTKGNGLVSIEQAMQEYADEQLILPDVIHLLTEYEKFASGDNYIRNKQLIDKQIEEFIKVNCA